MTTDIKARTRIKTGTRIGITTAIRTAIGIEASIETGVESEIGMGTKTETSINAGIKTGLGTGMQIRSETQNAIETALSTATWSAIVPRPMRGTETGIVTAIVRPRSWSQEGLGHEVETEIGIGKAVVDAVTATALVTTEAEADAPSATGADRAITRRTTPAIADFLMVG